MQRCEAVKTYRRTVGETDHFQCEAHADFWVKYPGQEAEVAMCVDCATSAQEHDGATARMALIV